MAQQIETTTEKEYRAEKMPSFLVALVCFAAINLSLFYALAKERTKEHFLTLQALKSTNYETRQEGPWIWWVTRTYLSEKKQPDVVLLGSSQMGSAIFSAEAEHRGTVVDTTDQREVTRLTSELSERGLGNPTVFNFSMGGAMVSDHFLLASALFRRPDKPRLAIIGVNPRDFMDNSLSAANCTDSFHFLTPYVKLGKLAAASFDDWFGLFDYKLKQYLPLKQTLTLLNGDKPPSLGNVATFTNPEGKGKRETGNRNAGDSAAGAALALQAISGSAGDVKHGEWALPATPPYLYMDNSKEYIKRYKSTRARCYEGQKAYFLELLSLLHKEGIKTVVIGMPSQKCNRDLLPASFWISFRQFLRDSSFENKATYVDLFDDPRFLADKDYLDTVHLNRWGGGKLVDVMADTVASKADLASALQKSNAIGSTANSWH